MRLDDSRDTTYVQPVSFVRSIITVLLVVVPSEGFLDDYWMTR